MPIVKTTPREAADVVRQFAADHAVDVHAHGGTLTAIAHFTPGDVVEYVAAEDACRSVLNLVRQTRPGSTWGTDGGSVGGAVGLEHGYCKLNRSGLDMRVLRYL